MKLSELKLFEYNKTRGIAVPLSQESLKDFLSKPQMLRTHMLTGLDAPQLNTCLIYRHDFGPSNCIYILKDKNSDDIPGYVTMKKIKDKIWQTEELNIFEKFRKLGLATELYSRIISVDERNIINGDGLSSSAEALWKALVRDKRCKVYDKKLNKIYPLTDIGASTDDGVDIKDPSMDANPEMEKIRFFYIAEQFKLSEYRDSAEANMLYECWLKGEKYTWADGDAEVWGHKTVAMSQEGDE